MKNSITAGFHNNLTISVGDIIECHAYGMNSPKRCKVISIENGSIYVKAIDYYIFKVSNYGTVRADEVLSIVSKSKFSI